MVMGPLGLYRAGIEQGRWRGGDAQQEEVACILDETARLLTQEHNKSWWARLLRKVPHLPEHGLYIYGPVGRGKTMLVDLFFQALPFVEKKRMHFHAFMQSVHHLLFTWRQKDQHNNLVERVARTIAKDLRVLCFDEFHVDNIADASILGMLLTTFFKINLFLVVTSNNAPNALYAGGLHRTRFLPCINLIETSMRVVQLASPTDYRLIHTQKEDHYYTGPQARSIMDALFAQLTHGKRGERRIMQVNSREWVLKNVCGTIVRATFEDLCGQPLGAADYLTLASVCRTLLLDDVPIFTPELQERMIRFMTLIDILYDTDMELAMSAQTEPDKLSSSPIFVRTASRLMEMRWKKLTT